MILRKHVIKLLRCYYALTTTIKNQVIFDSFNGKQYSDNPRAISEKMHEKFPDTKIVWILNKDSKDRYNIIPEYVVRVEKGSFAALKAFAESYAYVTNEALNVSMYKKRGQFFVQTWHGDRPFKKVLYEAWKEQQRPEPVMDNAYSDLCLAASDIGETVYRNAFHYYGDVLKIGMPRNDKLVKQDSYEQQLIKKRLGIPNDNKIVLYAPTFRDHDNSKQKIEINFDALVTKLENKGEKWICLSRAHSNSKGLSFCSKEKIVDVSDYYDMADLLLIADLLITDYSSSAGDFILCNKPVILTLFDYEEYISLDRELLFSPKDAGFYVAKNNEELFQLVDYIDSEKAAENCKQLIDFFNINETGESASLVCDIIRAHYKND